MKILGNENIRDIFDIFHDGGIGRYELVNSTLLLEIEIQYLAERIKENFSTFRLNLLETHMIVFEPWYDDIHKKEPYFRELGRIFSPELDILSADLDGDILSISCNQSESGHGYCGGFLKFVTSAATVQDQAGDFLSLDQLKELSAGYWTEFSKKASKNID